MENALLKLRAAFSTHGPAAGQRAHTELTGVPQWLLSASPCSFPCTLLSGFLSQLRSQSLCKPHSRGVPMSSCHHASFQNNLRFGSRALGTEERDHSEGFAIGFPFFWGFICSSPELHCLLHPTVHTEYPWSQRCGFCHQPPLPQMQGSLRSSLLIASLHSSPSQSCYNAVKE